MTEDRRRQEIEEAIRAGEKALISLYSAWDRLVSAHGWGIWDMIGGGFVTSLVKHTKIDEASSYLESAKMDLKIFQRELRDIPDFSGLGIDIGGFLSFADLFLDGIIADYIKGIRRYWLLTSLAHLIACTGCGETMSFEDG